MVSEKLIHSCANCSVGWSVFKTLTLSEISLVNENRYEATFKSGEIILKQGSPASSAVFLSKGLAKIFTEGENGKTLILEIVKPSTMIVGPGVHANSSNSSTVAALTSVQTCFISLDIIDQLINQNAAFAAGMVQDLRKKSFYLHNRLLSLTQKKMPGRLADSILALADGFEPNEEFDLLLTRQELGDLTNMTKESVVRILKELDYSGVIQTNGSKIRLLDAARLKEISEKG
jgi:CRP/FNR family transcriptional regulator, polysaccharide utilization system transcription regulator